jgi:nucleotide-binding universal stress UspA family protein
MENAWALSALWVGLALLAIWFRIATALSEIVVGTVAQLVIGVFLARDGLLFEKGSAVVEERAKGKAIALETAIVAGHPAEQIIHYADTVQASLVGMGKRSHSMFHRSMLGRTRSAS